MNPPSAWAVAKRDNSEGRRAVLDARHAGGPEGPLRGVPAFLLWHVELQQEQAGGQGLLLHICREGLRRRSWWWPPAATTCRRSRAMYDFETWEKVGPPKGTVYNYPPRGDEQTVDGGGTRAAQRRARRSTTRRIQTLMVAQGHPRGETIDRRIDWAAGRGARASCAAEAAIAAIGVVMAAGGGGTAMPLRISTASSRGAAERSRRHERDAAPQTAHRPCRAPARRGLHKLYCMRRRSTIAFLMALPLILLIAGLVVYPAVYAI